MTQEQKAKAYDEALERARKIHNEILNNELLGFPEQIREIFPQLKESEDERIRKGLIEALKTPKTVGELKFILPEPTREECIAYLEKQKDQNLIMANSPQLTESKRLANEVIEYLTRCGYSPVLKDDSKKEHFHIDIPRHKDDFWLSEEYKHCRSVLGEYYMEGDYGGDTYTLYIWRAKPHWKPSDAQMEALLNAEKYLNAGLQYDSAKRIAELIEQLSKKN